MRTLLLYLIPASLLAGTAPALAEPNSEIEILRAELEQMRSDYEARIADLERRLDAAEQNAAPRQSQAAQTSVQPAPPAAPAATAPAAGQSTLTGSGLFNPDLGVIFQGHLPVFS